jgi:hypothetical protein
MVGGDDDKKWKEYHVILAASSGALLTRHRLSAIFDRVANFNK